MSLVLNCWAGVDGGFPRVSGDEPSCAAFNTHEFWFSPRERG